MFDKGIDVKTEDFNTMTASLLYPVKGKCNWCCVFLVIKWLMI